MKFIVKYFITFLISLVLVQAIASVDVKEVNKDRPEIGLVLSGGGARGAAHVGVLKVLEDLRIPIDVITGTSMGAVVGGLYAYGYSPKEMETLLDDIDWGEVFIDKPPRSQLNYRRKQDDNNFLIKHEAGFKNGKFIIPTGLVQGQKLSLLLKSLTLSAPKDFDLLPIRYRAVAGDIETGKAVVMNKGVLATAMRASLSIPGVFSPVEWNGQLLVDGGFVNNVPVQLAKKLGADILIVVDLSTEPRNRADLSSPFSILTQTLGFQILKNSTEQIGLLGEDDILIRPDMGTYSSTDFAYSKDMVANGVSASKSVLALLKKLSLSEQAYEKYTLSHRQKVEKTPRIDNVVFNNQSNLSVDIVKSHINVEAGETLDLPNLERDLANVYGLNIFKSVDYEIDQATEENSLTITTKEKDWGPNYIRFGVNLESDLEGSSEFNTAVSYTVTPINASGGEWRTELQVGYDQGISTELYQPLDNRLQYFVSTQASYAETHFGTYNSGRKVADHIISTSQLRIDGGRLFGNWGSINIGVNIGEGSIKPFVGNLSFGSSDFDTGYWFVGFGYDQLDSLNFPKNGTLSNVTWASSREGLGADIKEDRLSVSFLSAGTWEKNTFIFWSGLAGVVNTETPTQAGYAIGGFLSLSGYENAEISGRYAGVVRLIYFREISGSKSVLKIPIYVGGSLETGNVWNSKDDISADSLLTAGSLLIAFDTPVGPLYLGRGFAEGGRSKSYLFLGRSFSFF